MNTDDYVHTNWPLVTSKKRSTRILEELLPVLKKKKKMDPSNARCKLQWVLVEHCLVLPTLGFKHFFSQLLKIVAADSSQLSLSSGIAYN